MFLQENWSTNGLVGSGQECYGAAVTAPNHIGERTLSRNPSSGNGYSRSFSYDVYGNMSVSAYLSNVPASPLMPLANQNPFNASNNRLNSSTYDDSAGPRVQKQVAGGATIVYVHDAFGQLVAEYNSAGITPVCTTCYLAYDQVGSVRLITDQNAGVVARHDYLPYGEEIPNGSAGRGSGNGFANSANVAQMFTGQERDGSTADLDYFNARHMSAYMGRFTQPDPANAGANIMNPQSWNAYAYVGGNPLAFIDPTGMDCESSVDGPCFTGEGTAPACKWWEFWCYFGSSSDSGGFSFSGSSGGGGGGGAGTTVGTKPNPPTATTPTRPTPPDIPPTSIAPNNAGHIAGCFAKGLVAGAATAVAVGVIAAVAAPVIGATAVTVGLGVLAVAGTAALVGTSGSDIYNHNWGGLAYNAGTVVGGLAGGFAGGARTATAIDPNATPGYSPSSWKAQAFSPSQGSWSSWFGSGPTHASAGLANSGGGFLSSLLGAGCR